MKDVYTIGTYNIRLSQIASLQMLASYQCRIHLMSGAILDLYSTSDQFIKDLAKLEKNFQLQ